MSKYARGVSVLINGERYLASHADLPPVGCARWTPMRKQAVVVAIMGGLLSIADACNRWKLTPEEVVGWMSQMMAHGSKGVKIKHIGELRREEAK